jgi:pimeloyl-ACP methyl ester carboxylesterase
VAAECVVLGVFWPSKKYGDPALTPGGAAGVTLRREGTYHLMKCRAGVVGRGAIASILNGLETHVHLIGHSFGARAITAAASAAHKAVASMTLLQAAFSQNSFGPEGAFKNVIAERKCAGPILITHSIHDDALGLCYPIASRIFRQNASGLGGANDQYGALGRNGALHTPEASFGDLLPEGDPYSFSSGRIFNLCADRIIQSHADIVKPEIAWALIAAAGLGRS